MSRPANFILPRFFRLSKIHKNFAQRLLISRGNRLEARLKAMMGRILGELQKNFAFYSKQVKFQQDFNFEVPDSFAFIDSSNETISFVFRIRRRRIAVSFASETERRNEPERTRVFPGADSVTRNGCSDIACRRFGGADSESGESAAGGVDAEACT
ncbi:MAG: hypothetical protein KA004_03365 [Verrucomicrobiales bacterium]|nr:hypothetical protein [Verrucomicrobiales bacterium]